MYRNIKYFIILLSSQILINMDYRVDDDEIIPYNTSTPPKRSTPPKHSSTTKEINIYNYFISQSPSIAPQIRTYRINITGSLDLPKLNVDMFCNSYYGYSCIILLHERKNICNLQQFLPLKYVKQLCKLLNVHASQINELFNSF